MVQPAERTHAMELVGGAFALPTMPQVLAELNEVVADPGASAGDVAAVVARDPVLAAGLLRVACSAGYGLPVAASCVDSAVATLGPQLVGRLARQAAVLHVFGKTRHSHAQFDSVGFWRHAVRTGAAARILGQSSTMFADPQPEDFYVAGLLHDVGKVIMLEQSRPRYLACLHRSARSRRPEAEIELEEFGCTHADVGAALAVLWGLSEDLAAAIRHHHSPATDPSPRPISSLLHLADHLAWNAGAPSTRGSTKGELDRAVHDRLGLSPEQVAVLTPRIEEANRASALPW